MDGVSSAFAVVSLAIQLVETGEKISKFLTGVQDAPSEVIKLGQTLDQLNSALKQVSYLLEQQYLVQRLPGSPLFITKALENCEERIKTLENVVQKAKTSMDHRNRVQRSWAAIKFVFKKEDILEMQSQLRNAEAGLQTAMLSNSWQLHMHQISILNSGGLQVTAIEKPSMAAPINSVSRYQNLQTPSSNPKDIFRNTTIEENLVWYRGFFGSVNVQSKSTYLCRSNTRRPGTKATTNEKIITITPVYLRKTLELRFLSSFGQISRTLSTYPILEGTAPIFDICKIGDLQGLQVALSSGSISPFVLSDEDGWSLLHYAAWYRNAELCALLLQLGVDSDRRDRFGYKAMTWVARCSFFELGKMPVDALRLLTQAQNDISPQDMFNFWSFYEGPVEGVEFMISQGLIQLKPDIFEREETFPTLATVIKMYGTDPSQWESVLRLLLRKGAGLHSPVPRQFGMEYPNARFGPLYPCNLLEYGTPLDEVFRQTETPFDGKAAADRWLDVLSSEGRDVMAYLEEEEALHASQMQLTFPSAAWWSYEVPRQLVFHWGSSPSVSWDWWIDTTSSTYLVREEFKDMVLGYDEEFPWDNWEDFWPVMYPAWSDHYRFEDDIVYSNWKPLYDLAQERANRRMEKKSKKGARAQGFKKRNQMPGAWPVCRSSGFQVLAPVQKPVACAPDNLAKTVRNEPL